MLEDNRELSEEALDFLDADPLSLFGSLICCLGTVRLRSPPVTVVVLKPYPRMCSE